MIVQRGRQVEETERQVAGRYIHDVGDDAENWPVAPFPRYGRQRVSIFLNFPPE